MKNTQTEQVKNSQKASKNKVDFLIFKMQTATQKDENILRDCLQIAKEITKPHVVWLDGGNSAGKRNVKIVFSNNVSVDIIGERAFVVFPDKPSAEIPFNPKAETIQDVFGAKFYLLGEVYLNIIKKDIRYCLFSKKEVMESMNITSQNLLLVV